MKGEGSEGHDGLVEPSDGMASNRVLEGVFDSEGVVVIETIGRFEGATVVSRLSEANMLVFLLSPLAPADASPSLVAARCFGNKTSEYVVDLIIPSEYRLSSPISALELREASFGHESNTEEVPLSPENTPFVAKRSGDATE